MKNTTSALASVCPHATSANRDIAGINADTADAFAKTALSRINTGTAFRKFGAQKAVRRTKAVRPMKATTALPSVVPIRNPILRRKVAVPTTVPTTVPTKAVNVRGAKVEARAAALTKALTKALKAKAKARTKAKAKKTEAERQGKRKHTSV